MYFYTAVYLIYTSNTRGSGFVCLMAKSSNERNFTCRKRRVSAYTSKRACNYNQSGASKVFPGVLVPNQAEQRKVSTGSLS